MNEFSNFSFQSQPFGFNIVTRHFCLRTSLSIAYARLAEILQLIYIHTPAGGVEFVCERRIDREGERADFKLTPRTINSRVAGWEVNVTDSDTTWQAGGLMVTRSRDGVWDAIGGTEEDQARAMQEVRRLEAEAHERVGRIVAEARFVRFDVIAVTPDEVRVAASASGTIAVHAMEMALAYARALWGDRLTPAGGLPDYPTMPDDERLVAARLRQEDRELIAAVNSGLTPAEIVGEQDYRRPQRIRALNQRIYELRKTHPGLVRPARAKKTD